MNETNEEKAQNFLRYVASNKEELKNNLKKNITYNPEIFDDVFSETIIKIYNSILKNGTDIEDYKQYFFISSKWTYALRDNNFKKEQNQSVRNYFDNHDISNECDIESKEREELLKDTFSKFVKILKDNFQEEDVKLFLYYYKKKVKGKYTLKQLKQDSGLRQIEISMKLKMFKDFINSNEEIKELKKLI